MAKYGPRVFPSDVVNTKNHWAIGAVWNATGSKGNIYNIEMNDKGFTCDCPAFKKCKHIKSVEEKLSED
mgnify:CR=1 FL=1|jgi:hypothetical protein|tara:strand:+ start:10626 stop:10832 length:207 start_codon:yes stop_codon:yes gene_type:complete